MKRSIFFILALCVIISCMAGFSFAEDAELAKINNYEQIAASTEYNLAVINNISWQVKPDGLGEFANDGAYNGDVYCTGTVGAKATVTFYGSVFGVIVQRGGWKITIDGQEAGNIEDSTDGFRVAYFTDKLEEKAHTAVIEITFAGGDWPKLDAFLVDADVSQENAKIKNLGEIAASTEYNLAIINNISWQVKPDGVGEFANDGAYNGDVYCTGTVGAKATVTFYGSVFGVIVQRGGWKITIDGQEAGNIEDSTDGFRVAYFTDTLEKAVHTAVIEITFAGGDWPKLDAFLVDADVSQENVKLPADVLALENIKVIDGDDQSVVCDGLGINEHSAHINNDAKFHGSSGGSLTLEFEGTTIGFICQKGAFDIYIDDELVDQVWKKNDYDKLQLAYYNDSLENGTHKIKVVANAELSTEKNGDNYCIFEGFLVQAVVAPVVTPSPVPTAAPTVAPTTAPTAEPTVPNPPTSDNFSIIWLCVIAACAVAVIYIVGKKKVSK